MQNSGEASPSIILASQALWVKMLISLEPHDIYGPNFVYLFILTLPSHWYETATRLHRASFGRSSSFNEMLITLELRGVF